MRQLTIGLVRVLYCSFLYLLISLLPICRLICNPIWVVRGRSGGVGQSFVLFLSQPYLLNILLNSLLDMTPESQLKLPDPWDPAAKPHDTLSWFCPGILSLSATTTEPLAETIYQARCEISTSRVCL